MGKSTGTTKDPSKRAAKDFQGFCWVDPPRGSKVAFEAQGEALCYPGKEALGDGTKKRVLVFENINAEELEHAAQLVKKSIHERGESEKDYDAQEWEAAKEDHIKADRVLELLDKDHQR